jgi:hypothetical protein
LRASLASNTFREVTTGKSNQTLSSVTDEPIFFLVAQRTLEACLLKLARLQRTLNCRGEVGWKQSDLPNIYISK